MLQCHEVADQMSDYVDGVLPWRQRLAIRLHLALCVFCRTAVRQLRATITVLGQFGQSQPPVDADDLSAAHRARELFRRAQ